MKNTLDFEKACRLNVENIIRFVEQQTQNRKIHEAIVVDTPYGTRLDSFSSFALFNGVFSFEVEKGRLDSQLKEACAHFASEAQPFAWWWLREKSPPIAIKNIFHSNGFESPGPYTCVLRQLTDLDALAIGSQSSISIRPADESLHSDLIAICEEVFDLDKSAASVLHQSLMPHENGSEGIHNYIAFYDGIPAGAATAFIHNGAVGFYNCATHHEFRNRGVLTALLQYALNDAAQSGCQYALAQLMAKNMAGGVFHKLGFKPLCRIEPYVHGMPVELLEP